MENYRIAVNMLVDVCRAEIEQLRYSTNHFRDIDTEDEELKEQLERMVIGIEKRIKVIRKIEGGIIDE